MHCTWPQIALLAETCARVPGDFIELGVFKGETFLGMARAWPGRLCHAVDSFRGMDEPTERDLDFDGHHQFPAGSWNVGGADAFREAVAPLGNVLVHEGFIPPILTVCESLRGFAFGHIDLDQYRPTVFALEWLWRRLNPGGLMVCHDWFPDSVRLAAAAIREWMAEGRVTPAGESAETRHIWFRK